MGKISRSFRLDESVLLKLDEIQDHLQSRLDHVSSTNFVKSEKATATKALEFAVSYAYEKLKSEGYVK